ncbi:GNAT family N-acetyltransferase [Bacillus sp. AK128]
MIQVNEKPYTIRNYQEMDAEEIGQFDFMGMLAYKYNRDYEPSNIFCAVNSEGHILGVGHLVPDQTWFLLVKNNDPSDFVYKLTMDISLNFNQPSSENVLEELFAHLLTRAKELRAKYPDKKISVNHVISSDDLEEIDFYLSKGFTIIRNHLIMKRDLTEPISPHHFAESIKILNWKMESEEEQERYLRAESESDKDGVSWSLNQLRWTKAGGEWDTFTAFEGDQIVGSVMTWGLGESRSATESIFVLPRWRRKGIAKAMITEALLFLKAKGKTEATLGVFGENQEAIPLYLSLGYKMEGINIELGLEI